MSGVSFDRAAASYDAARAIPPDAEARALDAVAQALDLGAGARALEACVGTARVAAPLAVRSFARVVGVDLSRAMLAKAREKRWRDGLQGDATRLPFRARSFDAGLFVHALHVIPDWRRAVAEMRRVLRPGAKIAVSFGKLDETAPPGAIREEVRRLARAAGVATPFHPGAQSEDEIEAELAKHGWSRERIEGARWKNPVTPREILANLAKDSYSYTWALPPAIRADVLPKVEAFARAKWGDLDRPAGEDARVVWDVYAPL